jgi:hypothetical protein
MGTTIEELSKTGFYIFYLSKGNQIEKINLKCVEHTHIKKVKILNTHLVELVKEEIINTSCCPPI